MGDRPDLNSPQQPTTRTERYRSLLESSVPGAHPGTLPGRWEGMTTSTLVPTATSVDRWVGALAHLGVPFMEPFLPLGVGAMNEQPFRKEHARQALTFQLAFIAIWFVVTVLTILLAVLPPSVLPVILGIAFLAEVPQITRALTGKPPLRLAKDSWRGGPFTVIEGNR